MVSDFIVQTKAAIARLTDPKLVGQTIELTNCDREPIHTPEKIQPHGIMLVLKDLTNRDLTDKDLTDRDSIDDTGADLDALDSDAPLDWEIIQVSQNSHEHIGRSPEAMFGQPLSSLLSEAQRQNIQSCLAQDFEAVNPLRLNITVEDQPKWFTGIVHRSNDVILLELEPTATTEGISFFNFHALVKQPMGRVRQTTNLEELCQIAVQEVQKITGYDRVMVYRFDEDDSGSVIAEVAQPGLESYLGLQYPATDIPKQAKYLYLLNLLRLIPDINYQPVPLVSAATDSASADTTVDMSMASLRSVSNLHVEYLRNMGVRATLAISLVRNNTLWGLLVCHHNSPRYLSYEMRTVCEFLGQVIALELNAKAENEDADYKLRLKAIQAYFLRTLPNSERLKQGLTSDVQKLLAVTGATGAAFCEKEEISLFGKTPELPEVQQMMAWISTQFEQNSVYHTASLSAVYAPANDFKDSASGLLALAISKVQNLYVLWFRAEVLQTVNWAGNPEKFTEVDDRGELQLSPRKSFERWQQTVEATSKPWKQWEIEAALELRSAVIGLVLQKADELAELNSELTRSNVELDSFAYIASHDLKEPLRGIHNYSSFLIEDYGTELGEDGVDKLHTLMRLTGRMEDLVNSLLHYSRLGRAALQLEPVPLTDIVNGVIEVVNISKPGDPATTNNSDAYNINFEVAKLLPVVMCDRTQVTELYTNLITNAIKYNDKDHKQIEIGHYAMSEAIAQGIIPEETASSADNPAATAEQVIDGVASNSTVFYVRDNGIGIREKHIDSVFRIFKRLHAQKRFGGGTGAGLTITKKIVERHKGRIWISSEYGAGSTFYFTLEANHDHA
ncbi:MAG: ATP-binding protein [Cyanobacteria bacterium J06621_11]